MRCPVHGFDDGYRPTEPKGTMAYDFENLNHALAVLLEEIGKSIREGLERLNGLLKRR